MYTSLESKDNDKEERISELEDLVKDLKDKI